MRHYEITLIVHPDQSSQVTTMIEKYKEIITKSGGNIHREEDWGRKHLASPINKIYKAHYLMMNIECDQETLDKLNYNFRFNDAVLRNLIISKSDAITSPSIMMSSCVTPLSAARRFISARKEASPALSLKKLLTYSTASMPKFFLVRAAKSR